MHAPGVRGDHTVHAVFVSADLHTAHLSDRGAICLVSRREQTRHVAGADGVVRVPQGSTP